MNKKYRSDAMAAIHETMEALHEVGAIDNRTMQRFDDACLMPIRPLKPDEPTALSASGSAARSGLAGPRSSCYR
jgi:putative transcriptional regulator